MSGSMIGLIGASVLVLIALVWIVRHNVKAPDKAPKDWR